MECNFWYAFSFYSSNSNSAENLKILCNWQKIVKYIIEKTDVVCFQTLTSGYNIISSQFYFKVFSFQIQVKLIKISCFLAQQYQNLQVHFKSLLWTDFSILDQSLNFTICWLTFWVASFNTHQKKFSIGMDSCWSKFKTFITFFGFCVVGKIQAFQNVLKPSLFHCVSIGYIQSSLVWTSLSLCWAYKILSKTIVFINALRLVMAKNISKGN